MREDVKPKKEKINNLRNFLQGFDSEVKPRILKINKLRNFLKKGSYAN